MENLSETGVRTTKPEHLTGTVLARKAFESQLTMRIHGLEKFCNNVLPPQPVYFFLENQAVPVRERAAGPKVVRVPGC
ncbi:hypothetical protein [Paracoccus yeei]|uniref:hypothetical protein n=1 Tax=Paracoccus yeei TaxID=147645 RepID=UPI001C8D5F21|nr:hypothetical protein [Paracoccus yeei]MBY0136887.1 hypothetical protein [Paracoccus yeei]